MGSDYDAEILFVAICFGNLLGRLPTRKWGYG